MFLRVSRTLFRMSLVIVVRRMLCSVRLAMDYVELFVLYNIYTVSTQHQNSDIMYATGYTVATCLDRKRSSSGQ